MQKVPSGMDSESFMRAWKSVYLFNRCTSSLMDNAIQYVYIDECMLAHLERIQLPGETWKIDLKDRK